MKQLKQFTIKEFEYYRELLDDTIINDAEILKLFGYDISNLSVSKYNAVKMEIMNMALPKNPVKRVYTINGRRFKACLNITKIKAGQFIDFQTYMKDFKLEQVLSVILIPQHKKLFKWVTPKYGDGYDAVEVQNYLYNNMTIGEASDLSNFYLTSSTSLLKVMKDYLAKKEMMMRFKKIKTEMQA